VEYFCCADWTGQISLKPLQKIARARIELIRFFGGSMVGGGVETITRFNIAMASKEPIRTAVHYNSVIFRSFR
jgi:hypothetical protein